MELPTGWDPLTGDDIGGENELPGGWAERHRADLAP